MIRRDAPDRDDCGDLRLESISWRMESKLSVVQGAVQAALEEDRDANW
jgi:hypothetical protein